MGHVAGSLAHQSPGDDGGVAHPQALPASGGGQSAPGSIRQHHHLCLHKQIRGHQVQRPLSTSTRDAGVVFQSSDRAQGSACPRCGQCPGGLSVLPEDRPQGMGPSPACGEFVVQNLGQTQYQPLCIGSQSQTPSILFSVPVTDSGDTESFLHKLGELLSGICIPTNDHPDAGPLQSQTGPGSDDPHSSQVHCLLCTIKH